MSLYYSFALLIFILSFNFFHAAKNPSFEFIPNEQNQIIIPVGIGTPKKTFNLLVDTNSPFTWIFNASSTKSFNKNKYNAKNSTTFKETSCLNYKPKDNKGNLTGICISETISLPGGISFNHFNLLVVDDYEDYISLFSFNYSVDGVLGLAFKYENIVKGFKEFSILDRLNDEKMLDNKLINIKFRNEYKGDLTLGKISENITTLYYGTCGVVEGDDGEWKCQPSRIEVGDIDKGEIKELDKVGMVTFDSGVNYIAIPIDNKDTILENMFPKDFQEKYNCNWKVEGEFQVMECLKNIDIGEMQNVYFIFDDYVMSYMPVDMFLTYNNISKLNIYFSDDKWIIGQVLMKNFLMIFDGENNIIRFSSRSYLINLSSITSKIIFLVCLVGFITLVIIIGGYILFIVIKNKFKWKFKMFKNFESGENNDFDLNELIMKFSNSNLIPKDQRNGNPSLFEIKEDPSSDTFQNEEKQKGPELKDEEEFEECESDNENQTISENENQTIAK